MFSALASFVFILLNPQTNALPCEASARTLRLLEGLECLEDRGIPYERRMSPLRALAEKNPNDFFIQRYYQDAFRREFYLADEYDHALALYRKSPDSWLSRYFEARLLLMVEPERSRKTFENIMRDHPGFVWPHLDLIELERLPGRRDPQEIEPHVKAFLGGCTRSPEMLRHLEWVQDQELLSRAATLARSAMERRNTPLDLALWPILWSVESRAAVDSRELQRRARADLNRIESWQPLRPFPDLIYVYQRASEILKDAAILDRLEGRVARVAPQSLLMQGLVRMRWTRENPPPPRNAPTERAKSYGRKFAQAEAEWRLKWPDSCQLAGGIWDEFLQRNSEGTANVQELLQIADRILRCQKEFPDVAASWPPFEVLVADLYVRHGVRLEEVLRLLDDGMRAIERQEKYRITSGLLPKELTSGRYVDNRNDTFERIVKVRIDYFLNLNRTAEARALIEQELAKIGLGGPGASTPATDQGRFRFRRNEWLRKLGSVSEKENRIEEALMLYQASLKGLPAKALDNPKYMEVASIKGYYLAHGGTEEKWLDWAGAADKGGQVQLPRRSLDFTQPVPEFAIKDLSGRRWRLEELRGKGTLINFWATWCGACRGEHPEIQKLHDRLKGSSKMQILTFSVDDDPALVTAYMKEKGYTFPVVHSPVLANKLFPYIGLPSNVLVNGQCRRTSLYGFGRGEPGLQQALDDLTVAAGQSK